MFCMLNTILPSRQTENPEPLHAEQPVPFLAPRNPEPRALPRRAIQNLPRTLQSTTFQALVVP